MTSEQDGQCSAPKRCKRLAAENAKAVISILYEPTDPRPLPRKVPAPKTSPEPTTNVAINLTLPKTEPSSKTDRPVTSNVYSTKSSSRHRHDSKAHNDAKDSDATEKKRPVVKVHPWAKSEKLAATNPFIPQPPNAPWATPSTNASPMSLPMNFAPALLGAQQFYAALPQLNLLSLLTNPWLANATIGRMHYLGQTQPFNYLSGLSLPTTNVRSTSCYNGGSVCSVSASGNRGSAHAAVAKESKTVAHAEPNRLTSSDKVDKKNIESHGKQSAQRHMSGGQSAAASSSSSIICRKATPGTHKRSPSRPRPPLHVTTGCWIPVGQPTTCRIVTKTGLSTKPYRCYAAIRHQKSGDIVSCRDCILVSGGNGAFSSSRKSTAFVGKVYQIWQDLSAGENDGDVMLSIGWYYEPAQTEPSEPLPLHLLVPQELFASRHIDVINANCIEDKCWVLPDCLYRRYVAKQRADADGGERRRRVVAMATATAAAAAPAADTRYQMDAGYSQRLKPLPPDDACDDNVFLSRFYYDIRTRKLVKNPSMTVDK